MHFPTYIGNLMVGRFEKLRQKIPLVYVCLSCAGAEVMEIFTSFLTGFAVCVFQLG